jgi:hypothetical protein
MISILFRNFSKVALKIKCNDLTAGLLKMWQEDGRP